MINLCEHPSAQFLNVAEAGEYKALENLDDEDIGSRLGDIISLGDF
jgi:hypothetical protein